MKEGPREESESANAAARASGGGAPRAVINADHMTHRLSRLTLVTVLVAVACPATAFAQKLVYIVRHAERADGGSMAPTAQVDPLLSAEGQARAVRIATMLGDAGIKAIFTTEYHRTQDTAKPLASKLGLTPSVVKSADTSLLVTTMKTKHANDIVLVVGHSSTIPGIVKALGGPDITIAESEYGDLWAMVPATGTFSRIRY